jgi:hypothetical protein
VGDVTVSRSLIASRPLRRSARRATAFDLKVTRPAPESTCPDREGLPSVQPPSPTTCTPELRNNHNQVAIEVAKHVFRTLRNVLGG